MRGVSGYEERCGGCKEGCEEQCRGLREGAEGVKLCLERYERVHGGFEER